MSQNTHGENREMQPSGPHGCKFRIAWRAECGDPVVEGEEYCAKHLGKKCCSCGVQATHECETELWISVCGAPLCEDCVHIEDPAGTGNYRHRPSMEGPE
jgi:hypothetical protein